MMTTVPRSAAEDEEKLYFGEQLEKDGVQPAQGELAVAKLSKEVTENQFSQEETAELESATKWKVKARRNG
jgi:hypothetical protein